MASKLFVDEIESSAASGISIVGEIKLNTGKAIKNAAGTALLTEAGALDNVSLGSSVTGTLGSGVVFPAGHILQFASDTDSGAYRGTHLATYQDLTGISLALTSKKLNSKFFLYFQASHAKPTTAGTMFMNIKRVITGGATTSPLVTTGTQGVAYWAATGWASESFSWTDSPSMAAGTTVTYSLLIKGNGGNTAYWGHEDGVSYAHIFEIGV